MSHRFFVYPLLIVMVLQLVPLLRHDRQWNFAGILQRFLILIAGVLALGESHHQLWVTLAWGLCAWLIVMPKLAAHSANRWLISGELDRAAVAWRGLAFWTWGRTARLNRGFASVLELWNAGREETAELRLEELADRNLPSPVRGEILLWHLWLLTASRDWRRVVDFYEGVNDWGTVAVSSQARLAAARAAAELGLIGRSIQYLFPVVVSPRTIGLLANQLWMTRICVTSLAGEKDELEWLLSDKRIRRVRGLARFAAVWRGRCALQRGDREEAGRQLARALAMTPENLPKSRAIIEGYLKTAPPLTTPDESVHAGLAMLRDADERMASWRNLVGSSRPSPVTAMLLILMTTVFFLIVVRFPDDADQQFIDWGGNVPLASAASHWWRPVTALFLHANWLHLLMNGGGLWMFGTALEKTRGWIRMLAIFLVAGTVANLISAYYGHFDVAVGASGAIFGLVGAFGVAVYRSNAPIPRSVRNRLLILMAAMVSIDLTIGGLESNIDNAAHICGLISGFLVALIEV